VAIMGRSGSGKSTLLNVLGLLDRPTAGSHRFLGRETAELSERTRTHLRATSIGYVFQAANLLQGRPARENVAVGLLYAGLPRRDRLRLADEWLTQVGLGERLHATPATMSGGEQQRVAIARALAKRPPLLLCDEPTGSLDSESAGQVLGLLETLRAAGQTTVVVTHDASVAERADRTLMVADGRIAA